MKQLGLSQIIGKNLRKALWALLVATLAINACLVLYDVQILTKNIYDSFASQLQNVARVSSQRGDMLSLQKDLEAVASPLAEAFSVDVEINDLSTSKMIVDIPGKRNAFADLFTRTVVSVLEVNPVGSLEAKVTFDISRIVLVALLKALLSSCLILVAIFATRKYVDQLNNMQLDPIDRFSKWLDSLGPEAFANQNIKVPTEGMQEELKIGLEAIAKKMADLSSQNAQLETEKQVGKIARRVAHDIRSPLSALNMLVSSVNEVGNEQKEIIEQVAKRINLIANNLLESTQHKVQRRSPLRKVSLNLASTLAEIIREKQIEYHNNSKVSFKSQFEGDLSKATVPLDPNEFKRILSNLINNSVEAMESEGAIVINAWAGESKAVVRVTDTGSGIPPAILEKLKQEPISSKATGAGIGIFSANEILEKQGHSLDIQSKPNVGTQVSITFNQRL